MLFIFDQQTSPVAAAKLVVDGFLSLLRQWALRREFWIQLSSVESRPFYDGIPSFYTINPFRPRRAAVVEGVLLTTAVFCLTCFAIRYSWIHVLNVRIPEVQFESSPWIAPAAARFDSREQPAQPRPANERTFGPPGSPAAPATPSSGSKEALPPSLSQKQNDPTDDEISEFPSEKFNPAAAGSQPLVSGSQASSATGSTTAIAEGFKLDRSDRHRVISRAAENLNRYYLDPEVAQGMAATLLSHEKMGDDDGVTDPEAFAALLTAQLQSASHDRYVQVLYSTKPVVESRRAPTPADIADYRREIMKSNCSFETTEILPHNIGYLKFNAFPDVSICGSIAASAMAKLNDADAIIFDLRDNPGGYASMVAFLATYLFDGPTHLNDFYDREKDSTEQSWTNPPIPGNKLVDKPVFVLTSSTTFSAAEAFSYDLKMLKRATLVGETTSGRGHMGALHPIDNRFAMRIPGIKVTNPISKSNWEGTGVEPDVKVKASDALETAERLAWARLQKR
jgi:hypothetical protein